MQNDMRDRLIDLLINADVYDSYECKLCTKEDYCDYCNAEKLANYLIANGVIIPPCKVGKTVYMVTLEFKIIEITVTNICVKVDYWETHFDIWGAYMVDGVMYQIAILPHKIGDTLFLTKEQAEQKLKEVSGKNDL